MWIIVTKLFFTILAIAELIAIGAGVLILGGLLKSIIKMIIGEDE